MPQTLRDIMTTNPIAMSSNDTLVEAARKMREVDSGDVLVIDDGKLCGIVTDRDIVTGAVADGCDVNTTTIDSVCSHEVFTVTPDDSPEHAAQLMREHAVRRLPVCEDGSAVGIVSIGDLAIELDEDSALADISAAEPNQ